MTVAAQIIAVLNKDLLVEWRSPSRFTGVLFFAFALLLMVAFASNTTDVMRQQAGGSLWVGLMLASTRSLDQSFAAELEHGALEGQVLWPVAPGALFLGKAIGNALILFAVGLALTPMAVAIYDVGVKEEVWVLVIMLLLGSMALAAPGTLLAAITSQARGSSVLLPMLLFPLVVPALMAAARGTTLVMSGDPMDQRWSWLVALLCFNIVHWLLASLLFGRVVEGGSQ